MQITHELREKLTPYLTLEGAGDWPRGHKPPTALYATVAALVNPNRIEASLVHAFSGMDHTSWRAWILTPKALAYVDLAFNVELFDELKEIDLLASGLNHKIEVDVREAYVRLLDDVVKAEFVPTEKEQSIKIEQTRQEWLPTPPIKLVSADNRVVLYLPGERAAKTEQERHERDAFLAAVRNHLPF
jgi:hypothetical protein